MSRAVFACAALVLLCVTGALGQQKCPAKQCDSWFNAMGGPIDCCYWDYAKNPKCVWAGTPVSWTQPGTCVENGKTYNILYKGNYQAAPNPSEYCRCKNDIPAPPLNNVQVCATLKPKPGFHIVGNDIGCDNLIYCKKCGGVAEVSKACGQLAKCGAIVMEDSSGCGYLKSAGGPLEAKAGYTSYVRE